MTDIRSLFPVLKNKNETSETNLVTILEKNAAPEVYRRIKAETGTEKIFRLSVFLTHTQQLLFIAPAGPDMNTDSEELLFCADRGLCFLKKLGFCPKIGIISGGREGDFGRNPTVDKTLLDAQALAEKLNRQGISAVHYTILIEDAVKEADFLILPDSVSGEMILKTVAGIGEGREIGNILLLKPAVGEEESDRIFIEQLTQKACSKDLEIFKEALEASFQ